jgi:hypothetical protein
MSLFSPFPTHPLLAHQDETINLGMYLIGCVYNLCTDHESLRVRLRVGSHSDRWIQRTPAMAAAVIMIIAEM